MKKVVTMLRMAVCGAALFAQGKKFPQGGKMQSRVFGGLGCIVIVTLMSTISCASVGVTTIHQDTSIPLQEHALLLPSGSLEGLVYVYGIGKKSRDRTIGTNIVGVIPPGHQTVYVAWEKVGYSESQTFPIEYEFQAGKRYVLAANTSGGFIVVSGTAQIYTVDEYRDVYARMYPNDDGSGFQSWVLDRFDKAELELSQPQ